MGSNPHVVGWDGLAYAAEGGVDPTVALGGGPGYGKEMNPWLREKALQVSDVLAPAGSTAEASQQLASHHRGQEHGLCPTHPVRERRVPSCQVGVGTGIKENLHLHRSSSTISKSAIASSSSLACSSVHEPMNQSRVSPIAFGA